MINLAAFYQKCKFTKFDYVYIKINIKFKTEKVKLFVFSCEKCFRFPEEFFK